MATFFLAAGLDPSKCTLFVQSLVPEHAELHLIFSNITPLGWLERVPTYKEQRENITDKDIGNYAFLGYPVLQAADICMYKGDYVPVGKDQAAHVELTREIARRFHHFYPVFPEPEALHTEVPVLPGIDGRKMSKSYGNTIELSDPPDVIREKVRRMITDRTRIRRTDPGHPEACDVCQMHRLFVPPEVADKFDADCRSAAIGCVDRKRALAETLIEYLAPISGRMEYYRGHQNEVREITRGLTARTRRGVRV